MSFVAADTTANRTLGKLADRHLWGHFSSLGSSVDGMPVIERGDGCYIWDNHGNRYLDGLAGLYTTQVGHGRTELAQAAGSQASQLGFFPIWTYAHPKAVELAARLAELSPGDLNRVFFTSGGSEAVESAWKLARQYFKLKGEPLRTKVISRDLSYHGTTMGALSITGLAAVKGPFEPLVPGAIKVPNTNTYRRPPWVTDDTYYAEEIEQAILREGPETIAAVFLEPVQNAGGCFTPPEGYFARVREICDTHGVLLVSDEVICAFGRLGHWFGSQRLGYQPDIITSAKGITSGYAPLGAMLVSDRIAEPFADTDEPFLHGYTFAGHPVSCAVALANLDLFEKEDLLTNVLTNEDTFRAALDDLKDLPIVGDVRGMGYFYGIELVKDRDTKETFTNDEAHHLLRSFLSNRMAELGLICRADSRGEPVIQLSPPLIAGAAEFEVMNAVLRESLTEAMSEMEKL
ncbi:MAG: aspartate aminotransferase family protein [Actinomycetia bacterium]|nr:aspartate aminotransferase family protein [Actinomycetes bacterium]